MYIVAIAWIFVTLLMALTEPSVVAGILSFGFYGLLPLGLFLWLVGTPQRRRNQALRVADPPSGHRSGNQSGHQLVDHVMGKPDGRDTSADQ